MAKMRKALVERITQQIDVVIEAGRTLQAEAGGPDPDYRRTAQKELDNERDKLICMITGSEH